MLLTDLTVLREGERGKDYDGHNDRCRGKTAACRRGALPFGILDRKLVIFRVIQQLYGNRIVYFVVLIVHFC